MADLSQLSGDPRLNHIHPTKLKILEQIARDAKGRPLEEMLPQIMMINKELKQRKLEFTKEESELLMDVLAQDMNPNDKQRFMMLKNMLS